MDYDVNYFIEKFSKIEDSKWNVGNLHSEINDSSCALGHCGISGSNTKIFMDQFALNNEAKSLVKLFNCLVITTNNDKGFYQYHEIGEYNSKVVLVNDGAAQEYRQTTAKKRILAALYDIKKMQQHKHEVRETIKYVAVDAEMRESVKEYAIELTN